MIKNRLDEIYDNQRDGELDDKSELEQFHNTVEGLKAEMSVLGKELNEIQLLHEKVLLLPLSSDLAKESMKKSENTHGKLRKFVKEVKELDSCAKATDKSAINRIKRDQINWLIQMVAELFEKYTKDQFEYQERRREKTDKDNAENDKTQMGLNETQSKALLNEANQEPIDNEKSIRDLQETLQDLQFLNEAQEGILDNIKSNVEQAFFFSFK